MQRFSTYSILSAPLTDGSYVLLNGLSGAMDLLTRDLGEALREPMWAERPQDANGLIGQLPRNVVDQFRERGHITEMSEDEERQLVVTIADAMHEHEVAQPRFMIVPNMDCNYRCTYCFERPLQNALKSKNADISHLKGNVVLSPGRVEAIYDGIEILQREANGRTGGQIILYGGEPLDRKNEAVVRRIVEEGLSRGYFFAAITNGHDLDAFMDLLGAGKIEQVQISIDGPKEVHDKRRVYIGRESSFDRLVANIRRAVAETDAQIQIRVHVDPGNIDLFEEVLEFFDREGWLDASEDRIIVYANTVYAKDGNGRVTVGLDNGEIVRRISAITTRYSNVYTSAPAIHAARASAPAFVNGDRFGLKGTYCSANAGNYIFAADGCLYACWESVGKECSRIGRYDGPGGIVLDERAVAKWFQRSIATLPECQKCAHALICGGGCAQYAEYEHGNPYRPYCDDFQRVFRHSLAERAEVHLCSGRAQNAAASAEDMAAV